MKPKHEELLRKFANNTELFELFEETILYEFNEKEEFYLKNGYYPPLRDHMGALKNHLLATKSVIQSEKEE